MFPKDQRISSVLFTRIFKTGRKKYNSLFRASFVSSKQLQVSVVVPKKRYKKRTDRNYIKRMIMHAIRELSQEEGFANSFAVIIWVQKDVDTFDQVKKELSGLLRSMRPQRK